MYRFAAPPAPPAQPVCVQYVQVHDPPPAQPVCVQYVQVHDPPPALPEAAPRICPYRLTVSSDLYSKLRFRGAAIIQFHWQLQNSGRHCLVKPPGRSMMRRHNIRRCHRFRHSCGGPWGFGGGGVGGSLAQCGAVWKSRNSS